MLRAHGAVSDACRSNVYDVTAYVGLGFRVTWRFMGSSKWGYKSPNMA